VLAAPDRDVLVDWLRHRPLLHVDGGYAMVHGGLHPRWTIEAAHAIAAEIERELRGPRWREVLAELPGAPPKWDARSPARHERAPRSRISCARGMLDRDGRVVADYDGRPPARRSIRSVVRGRRRRVARPSNRIRPLGRARALDQRAHIGSTRDASGAKRSPRIGSAMTPSSRSKR